MPSGGIVARLSVANDRSPVDVVSPISGSIARLAAKDGAQVGAGDAIAVIGPGETQVFEALRALLLVGQLEGHTRGLTISRWIPGRSERVRQQDF